MTKCDLKIIKMQKDTSGCMQEEMIQCDRDRAGIHSTRKFGRLGLCEPCGTALTLDKIELRLRRGVVVTDKLPKDDGG